MLPTPPRRRPRRAVAFPTLSLALGLTLGACADEPTRAFAPEPPRDERTATHALGLVEITISGLSVSGHSDGSTQASVIAAPSAFALERMRAHAAPRLGAGSDASAPGSAGRSIAADPDGSVAASPSGPIASSPGTLPVHADASGDGTIQLEPLSVGSFTVGSRGDGGYRYVSATYRVRNAQADSTAYDTPRQNLTFYAVSTSGTLGKTPFSRLARFDGSAAATDPATILPTGAARLDPTTGEVRAAAADVLQVVSEEEAARLLDLAVADTETVFPYGFVVRNPADPTSRTLPANPAEDEFDGLVTFAFKIPLASSSADDPFTVSAVFMAVDEDDVVVTQSLEEQTPEGQAAFEARATALGASRVTLLPGGTFGGAAPIRTVCTVRTAGTTLAPTAYLVRAAGSLMALSPDPYTAAGRAVAWDARLTARFDGPVAAADAHTFVVRGLQSGHHFIGAAYDGAGTDAIVTPAASFLPGEELEVVLTDALASCPGGGLPHVARLRAAVEPGGAGFTSSMTLAPGGYPETVALADLNGDGVLDLVTTITTMLPTPPYTTTSEIHVVINDGDLSNPTVHTLSYSGYVKHIAVGDLTGDGILDLAVATDGPHLLLYPGIGDGTFGASTVLDISGRTTHIALGDLNGDGNLDIVVTESSIDRVVVLLSNGDGTFAEPVRYPTGMNPRTVVLADFNGDGALDIAHTIQGAPEMGVSGGISIRLGDGQGGFGEATVYDGGRAPVGLVAADLNGDDTLDLAVANWNLAGQGGTISILSGNGGGTFRPRMSFEVPQTASFGYIAAGDLNGDGHVDLVSAFDSGNRVNVHINDGTGSFSTAATPFATRPRIFALGDLNGDGRLDIAAPQYAQSGSTRVIFND